MRRLLRNSAVLATVARGAVGSRYARGAPSLYLSLVLLEIQGGAFRREETLVQVTYRSGHIALFHYEADIDFGRPLGNHADVHISFGDGVEHAGRDAGFPMNVFTHQADDRLPAFAGDVGNLLQFAEKKFRQPFGFHGEREADFRD